jgi:hypothetical protein
MLDTAHQAKVSAMQIGAVYPQTELAGDPVAVRQIGTAVEALGYDHLLAYDHVLGAVHADRTPPITGPDTEHHPFHDPLVMFAPKAKVTLFHAFRNSRPGLRRCSYQAIAQAPVDVDETRAWHRDRLRTVGLNRRRDGADVGKSAARAVGEREREARDAWCNYGGGAAAVRGCAPLRRRSAGRRSQSCRFTLVGDFTTVA